MSKIINVLIAEDEPIIIELLKTIFKQLTDSSENYTFKLHPTRNCDSALEKIDKAANSTFFNLALLDINLPSSKQRKILCGEDLGIELRNRFPEIKIIIYTANNDNYRLNNILHTVNPDGFLIKSDVDYQSLKEAICKVITNPPHYSHSILSLIRQHISSDFILDSIDRTLLYEISKGTRTKDLPNFVNLSKGGVELRKRRLKEIFNIDDKGDKKLIEIAKEKGYV